MFLLQIRNEISEAFCLRGFGVLRRDFENLVAVRDNGEATFFRQVKAIGPSARNIRGGQFEEFRSVGDYVRRVLWNLLASRPKLLRRWC